VCHILCNINNIEYEHYSTSDSGHKEDSRFCKQAKRRRQEQAKAFPDACENLSTTTMTCRFIFTRSQIRKQRRPVSQNKRDNKDQRFNSKQRKRELVFNNCKARDRKTLNEICKRPVNYSL
jgi:hypothetical protein